MMIPCRNVLLIFGIAFAVSHSVSGTTLLDDDFNDGDLATNPGPGGGFVLQDNGFGADAIVTESASLARIEEGSSDNTAGIRSTNAHDLSDPGQTYRVTWQIANWGPGASGVIRRMFFALQTNDDWLFNGTDEESRLLIEIDEANDKASFRYQNRSGGLNTNFLSGDFDLGNLEDDPDGFVATLTVTSIGFRFSTAGLNADRQVDIFGTWEALDTDFTTVFGTDGPMRVTAYTQDVGTTGSPLDIDRITLTSEPYQSPATLLDDDFNNDDLATNPDTGGGFVLQDNGLLAAGSVVETGSQAQITEGGGSNTTGIRSTNAFDLSDEGLSYRVTWEVDHWAPGTSGSERRIFLALQTNDSWLFAGDPEESRLLVEIDERNNDALLRYQDRSGGTNTNFDSATVSLGILNNDPDGFTATLILDSTGFSFATIGLDATHQVGISDTWANLGTDLVTVLGTKGPMHVAAYSQDTGSTGSPLDIARIRLTTSGAAPFPLSLEIARNGANLDFEWNSRSGALYTLVSSTDLTTPISAWPTYDDGVNTYAGLAPSGTGINTLTGVIPLGPRRFFAIIEE